MNGILRTDILIIVFLMLVEEIGASIRALLVSSFKSTGKTLDIKSIATVKSAMKIEKYISHSRAIMHRQSGLLSTTLIRELRVIQQDSSPRLLRILNRRLTKR